MKKILFALILIPSVAHASCENYGLYAFALSGCDESTWGVDTSTPLCQQPKWRHLAAYDYRCYEPVPIDWSRYDWDAPTPYDNLYKEPISGKLQNYRGTYEQADWNYRACRQTLGALRKNKNNR